MRLVMGMRKHRCQHADSNGQHVSYKHLRVRAGCPLTELQAHLIDQLNILQVFVGVQAALEKQQSPLRRRHLQTGQLLWLKACTPSGELAGAADTC